MTTARWDRTLRKLDGLVLGDGELMPVDGDGFLIPIPRRRTFDPPWAAVVAEVHDAFVERLASRLHSLYLRGSLARGRGIEGVSDLDLQVVLRGEERAADLSWVADLHGDVGRRHPFLNGLDLGFASERAVLESPAFAPLRFFLKTQSVWLWGEDLDPLLPRLRPGPDIAFNGRALHGNLRQFLGRLRPGRLDAAQLEQGCAWIMKNVVRTGFELVMAEERGYTRDLALCYRLFAKHFPDQEPQMRRALSLAVEPSSDAGEIREVLLALGPWLLAELEHRLGHRLGQGEPHARR